MELDAPFLQWSKEISLCPIERPIVDALSYVKTIAKVDHSPNIMTIEVLKERSIVEFLKVIVE